MHEIRIECPKIFDYEKCLDYLKRDENEVLFEVEDHKIYRAINLDGERLLMCIYYHRHYLIVEILNDVSVNPTTEVIANVSVQELMDLKFSRRKAEYLIDIAKRMHSQMLSKDMLLDIEDTNDIERTLIKIRGIGPWTAHYVMMRALGVQDAFPIGDVGLQNALKDILNLDKKPSKEQMLSLNEGWHEWSSYATFYIWRAPHIQN